LGLISGENKSLIPNPSPKERGERRSKVKSLSFGKGFRVRPTKNPHLYR
jgi:hypothetical protein